jgi:hypothetical protein
LRHLPPAYSEISNGMRPIIYNIRVFFKDRFRQPSVQSEGRPIQCQAPQSGIITSRLYNAVALIGKCHRVRVNDTVELIA